MIFIDFSFFVINILNKRTSFSMKYLFTIFYFVTLLVDKFGYSKHSKGFLYIFAIRQQIAERCKWPFRFRYLRDTQHFIDKRRVAVWGWSYGGFVATLALASPKNVFQCAIAVSPVTNWRLYGKVCQFFFLS